MASDVEAGGEEIGMSFDVEGGGVDGNGITSEEEELEAFEVE